MCKATNTLGGEPVQCQKVLGHTDSHYHRADTWASVHWPNLRSCGHAQNTPLCACVKVRKEPITPEEAFLLLARSL